MAGPATLEEVLRVLREKQSEARALGVELVGVAGSLARGEARPDSDVDIIARYRGGGSYFKIFDFEEAVAAEIGRPIDLVFSEGMSQGRRAYIERDLVAL